MTIILNVAIFLLGFTAEKILDFILGKVNIRIHKKRIEDNLHNFYSDSHIDVAITASGIPFFSAENIREGFSNTKAFRLALPEDEMVSNLSGFSDIDCGAEEFMQFVSKYSLSEKLNLVRLEVARSFAGKSNGNYFNGKMYGVYRMDDFSRTQDAKEAPILSIDFYETDYYTHKITEELMKNISVLNDHNKDLPSLLNDDLYRWTRSSFGVSVIMILPKQNEIVLTRRSKNSAYTEGKEWIYVSVTETLSTTDFNTETGCPDLPMCVFRGSMEELGISQRQLKQDTLRFYDAFYETHFHQDNIVASIEVSESLTFSDIYSLLAKDKKMEVADILTISNEKATIQSFIEKNKDIMRSQTIFALESYIARM